MEKTIKYIVSIIILIVVVMAGIIIFCNKDEYMVKEPFSEDDGIVIAVYYIGSSEGNYSLEGAKKYIGGKGKNLELIKVGGTERYLIIPRNDNIKIDVYSVALNEEYGMRERLIREASGSFILECNESDIYSNVALRIRVGDNVYKYSPYISLKDGSVVTDKFVINIDK